MSKRSYREVASVIGAICEGENDVIAKMATVSCEIFHAFEEFHWVGFYRAVGDDLLKVGPYQGGHGCLSIPFNKGVCGLCARSGEPQIVGDVNAIADHIACSASTQSELVVPVFCDNRLIAVFDIDSDNLNEFDDNDAGALTEILNSVF